MADLASTNQQFDPNWNLPQQLRPAGTVGPHVNLLGWKRAVKPHADVVAELAEFNIFAETNAQGGVTNIELGKNIKVDGITIITDIIRTINSKLESNSKVYSMTPDISSSLTGSQAQLGYCELVDHQPNDLSQHTRFDSRICHLSLTTMTKISNEL